MFCFCATLYLYISIRLRVCGVCMLRARKYVRIYQTLVGVASMRTILYGTLVRICRQRWRRECCGVLRVYRLMMIYFFAAFFLHSPLCNFALAKHFFNKKNRSVVSFLFGRNSFVSICCGYFTSACECGYETMKRLAGVRC